MVASAPHAGTGSGARRHPLPTLWSPICCAFALNAPRYLPEGSGSLPRAAQGVQHSHRAGWAPRAEAHLAGVVGEVDLVADPGHILLSSLHLHLVWRLLPGPRPGAEHTACATPSQPCPHPVLTRLASATSLQAVRGNGMPGTDQEAIIAAAGGGGGRMTPRLLDTFLDPSLCFLPEAWGPILPPS